MAQEIREFAVTVPPGTPVSAPLVTSVAFPERQVTAVSWRVPPGPSGKLGWALTSAGAPVIPIQRGTYIVTDNQADTWPLAGYLDSGNWAVTAYNTGVFPHTIYLTFLLDLIGTAEPLPAGLAGAGIGVIGTAGTVTPPASPSPPPSPPAPSPDAATVAAITTMIMAMMSST